MQNRKSECRRKKFEHFLIHHSSFNLSCRLDRPRKRRAKIKVMVKRILRKHGYPPDLEEEATKTVLAQAELLCADWAA